MRLIPSPSRRTSKSAPSRSWPSKERIVKTILAAIFALWTLSTWAQSAADMQGGLQNGLRGPAALDQEGKAPAMPKMTNDDIRKGRAFAMQPPLIPHQIENYQIDRNFNKCMTCHARERVAESQAPM